MTPRKTIGVVPGAIESTKLGGLYPHQFLRFDAINATSTSGTFLSIYQNGAGNIAQFFGPGSTTVMVLTSGGNVGIGTSTPAVRLDIYGSAGSGNIFAISSSTNARLVTVTAAGNVGIGTSTPWASLSVGTGEAVQMYNSTTAQKIGVRIGTSANPDQNPNPGLKVERILSITDAIASSSSIIGDGVEAYSAIIGISKGVSNTEVQPVGVSGFGLNNSTSNPVGGGEADALGVYGVGRITGSGIGVGLGGFFAGRRDNDTGKYTGVEVSAQNYGTAATTYNSTGYSSNGMWINAIGNANTASGIIISNPFGRQFQNGISFTAQVAGGLTGGVASSTIRDDSSSERSLLINGTHSIAAIGIASGSGWVGIGTTTPRYMLDIVDTVGSTDILHLNSTVSQTKLVIENSGGSGYPALTFLRTGVRAWMMGLDYNDSNKFKISSTEASNWAGAKFTIDTSGNVGIGTTTPNSALTVAGNITATGTLSVASTTLTNFTAGSIPFFATGGSLNQNNAVLFWDNTNSRLGIGTNAPNSQLNIGGPLIPTSAGTAALNISSTISTSSIGQVNGFYNGPVFSPNTGAVYTNTFGLINLPTFNSSSGSSTNVYGAYSRIDTGASFTGLITNAVAFAAANPSLSGTQSITNYFEFQGAGLSNGNGTTGSINNFGFYVGPHTAAAGSGGSINNYASFFNLGSGSGAGTTNNYGLFITGNGGTGGAGTTNNYAIYSNSTAKSYLAGNVGIGTSTPGALLDVWGNFQFGTSSIPLLFGDTAIGRLGIGTSAPTARLAIAGSSGSVDQLLDVASSSGASYLRITSDGNVGIGTSTPMQMLAVSSTQTSGTITRIGSPSAVTLAAALTGLDIDLSTAYTATGFGATGGNIALPTVTNTGAGAYAYNGLSVTSGALVQNTAGGTTTFKGLSVTTPNITQTTGSVVSNGLFVANGTITTAGTQNMINISGTGVGAGTLNGLNISNITGSTGAETGLLVGTGWDSQLTLVRTAASTATTSISIDFGGFSSTNNGINGIIKMARVGTGTTTCRGGIAQGLVFQSETGVQVGHFCWEGAVGTSTTGLKAFGLSWTASATDLAENYSDVNGVLEPGDVIMLDNLGPRKSIKKSASTYDSMVIGIVSTEPGFLLNDIDESGIKTELINPKPVALAGRVPVKVSNINGAISVGDYLASSDIPGVAMKATKSGHIVGQALEAFNSSTQGSILVFVERGYYNGQSLVDKLELAGVNVADADLRGKAVLSEFLSASSTNNFNSYVAELSTDRITAGLEIITPRIVANGLAVDYISANDKEIEFKSDVIFFGRPYFTTDTAGFAKVKQNDRKVQVLYDNEYIEKPVVNITMSIGDDNGTELSLDDQDTFFANNISYAVVNASTTGFTIILNKNAPNDILFNWTALAVKNTKTFTSVGEVVPRSVLDTEVEVVPPATTGNVQPVSSTTKGTLSATGEGSTTTNNTNIEKPPNIGTIYNIEIPGTDTLPLGSPVENNVVPQAPKVDSGNTSPPASSPNPTSVSSEQVAS